jgi:hypothetical protein
MDAFELVSLSDLLSGINKRVFSLPEANRAVTLVRRIVADIVRDYDQLCELHAVCKAQETTGDACRAEAAREKYARVTDHLSELQEELEKVGCEIKDYRVGLVDFPTVLDGREASLCWQLGETHVSHWHESEIGCAGRQSTAGKFE